MSVDYYYPQGGRRCAPSIKPRIIQALRLSVACISPPPMAQSSHCFERPGDCVPDYLLRVEGQNLGSFIDDTQDLSTIRGGSLALLSAVRELADAVEQRALVKLEAISTGASTGVWSFVAPDIVTAQKVAAEAQTILQSGAKGNGAFASTAHATFSVVTVAEDGGFLAANEAARAIALRNQMLSASLAYPAVDSDAREICPVDLVRPVGADMMFYKTARTRLSASVYARRKYGLAAKQRFYETVLRGDPIVDRLSKQGSHPFALQLDSISERFVTHGRLRQSLQDKICVLYMDGNGFGDLQRRFIVAAPDGRAQADRQREFDDLVQSRRRALLASLLGLTLDNGGRGAPSAEEQELRREDLKTSPPEVIRFETLLWGGDEMIFVLPARLGWTALSKIVSTVTSWTIEIEGQERPMHHAVGVGFCHHNAPIARIEALVKRLADHAKDLSLDPANLQPAQGRAATLTMPIVLESFDHVGHDLEPYLQSACRPELRTADPRERDASFVLRAGEIDALQLAADALAEIDFPRRRLKMLAHAIHWPGRHGKEDFESLIARAKSDMAAAGAIFDTLFAAFGGHDRGAMRAVGFLEQLWDYLLPVEATEART